MVIFFLGYWFRGLVKRVETIEQAVKQKLDKPVKIDEPESTVIDPNDPLTQAMFEQREMMRKLNGG